MGTAYGPSQHPRDVGRRTVAQMREVVKERVATMLQRDPERLAHAVEIGLVSRAWLDDPRSQPISTSTPLDVVVRYLERTIEQRPSTLAALGLSAIQILSSESADDDDVESNQRLAVAFTDLEGFTRFTSTHGDEAASDLLADLRRESGPIIRSRGGRVVKRIGDGLLVTFLESEAAVLACLELAEHPSPLRLRAGVHVGGVRLTPDDVVGHTVNIAARIAEAAKGGDVLVSADVRRAVGELPGVEFGRARSRSFKGVSESISVCRVSRG